MINGLGIFIGTFLSTKALHSLFCSTAQQEQTQITRLPFVLTSLNYSCLWKYLCFGCGCGFPICLPGGKSLFSQNQKLKLKTRNCHFTHHSLNLLSSVHRALWDRRTLTDQIYIVLLDLEAASICIISLVRQQSMLLFFSCLINFRLRPKSCF